MVKELDPHTVDVNDLSIYDELLAEFNANKKKQARGPYVLYGHIGRDYYSTDGGKSYKERFIPNLFKLDISSSHATFATLSYYATRQFKILDYFMPTKDMVPVKRGEVESGWVLEMRQELPKWKEIEGEIKRLKGELKETAKMSAEIKTLRDKLAATEQKIAKTQKVGNA